jgi:uncharacterized membrane protein
VINGLLTGFAVVAVVGLGAVVITSLRPGGRPRSRTRIMVLAFLLGLSVVLLGSMLILDFVQ